MKCRCTICNAEIDNKTGFLCREYERHDKNGLPYLNKDGTPKMKREYCCSEREYSEYIKHKAEMKAAEDEMWSLVREYVGDTFNSTLFTERAKWGDARRVCRLIKEHKDKFDFMNTKNFTKISSKIMYFSAIVKNNIDDLPDEEIVNEPVSTNVEIEFYENRRTSKLRKGLIDYE